MEKSNLQNELIARLQKLKQTKVREIIAKRIAEFESKAKQSSKEIFKELCFCILTANFNAERSMIIQDKIGDGFISLPKKKLATMLGWLGHRFPNTRADYIVNARHYAMNLKEIIFAFEDSKKAREWLVKNIKGIGYKEASHFLRNIGFKDLAIVDFHILDLLQRYGIVNRGSGNLTRKDYLEIEKILRSIAKHLKLSLAELDLYLWYMETGKVLK